MHGPSCILEVLFYFVEKIKTHLGSEHQRDNTWALNGLMVVLKSFGSGRVVIPPHCKADMVEVIAQLISAVKIYKNVHLKAAGSIKPLCCNLTLASPSNSPSRERLWSQRAVYSLIMLFQTLCGLAQAFHMCYLCNYYAHELRIVNSSLKMKHCVN